MRVRSGLVVAVIVGLGLSGCVSKWAYDDQVEINDHLRTVKTEQDIERDGLHADVQALNRAYSSQSVRVTTMEGLVNHAMSELKSIRFTLASMTKEQEQIRGDVTKLHTEASESLQFLRTINEQQQGTKQVLDGLSIKLDAFKKPAPVKTAKLLEPAEKRDEKKDVKEPSGKERGAVQRSIDQKLGLAPVSGASPAPVAPTVKPDAPVSTNPGVKAKNDSPGGLIPTGVSASGKTSDVLASGADRGDASGSTGQKLSGPPTTPSAVSDPSVPAKSSDVAPDEPSPLLRKAESADVLKAVTPVKQTWGEWISEKLGRKKVQTAQQQVPVSEKKDVAQ